MKSTLSVLMIVAAGIVRASGDAVSCSVIDYLYYSSDCCDNSNSVQCMESIPQTDKAAIDNLATLKRSDGAACQSGDSINYYSDGANFTGLVCTASGPAVDCVFTWSNYSSCVNGEKTRTSTVSTPAYGGGTACPASPETAVCTGAIGDACTDNAHCDSNTCDIGGTDVCVAAPTLKLDDGSSGYADAAAFLAANTLIADKASCIALADDIKAAVRLIAGQETYEYYDDANPLEEISLASSYPKGCSVRLGTNANERRLYWNNDENGAVPSANNIAVVAP